MTAHLTAHIRQYITAQEEAEINSPLLAKLRSEVEKRMESEMQIIRDEATFGLMMIPLFCDWGLKRCNVEDCTERPSTIITDPTPEIAAYALCEEHYQGANKPGGTNYTLIFDDFDAFKSKSPPG